jgi:maleate cis-trans isomerase
MKIGIYNHETGEQEVRDMTEEEVAAIEADTTRAAEKLAAEEAKVTAKAALLDRLGITAEEAALLLG